MNHLNELGFITVPLYKDLEGNAVERPKHKYPYSYSPYVVYRNGDNSDITDCVYSDRLYQWNPKKYNKLCLRHFGNNGQKFFRRKPQEIENFLKDYMENESLKLIAIQQGANVSNGYPYWIFHFG